MRIAIFSAHNFEKPHLEAANAGRHELVYLDTYLTTDTAVLSSSCDAVALFANDDGSAEVLKRLHDLNIRYIALRSAGYNHIDLTCAKSLGIRVANVPAYSPYSVAEHTVALMLALNRKLIRANSRVKELNFSLDGLTGFDMNGKTAGIVGTGKIGRVVARILHGFGCTLYAYDLEEDEELKQLYGLRYVDLEALCEESDIITLHTPLNAKTHHMINRDRIASMKPGVMLINTSRGGLVDTKAVIDALKTGHIKHLGLDVYEEEKGLFFEDHSENVLQDDVIARLLTFNNVLITSHQAFLTETALQNIADTTIHHLDRWQNNQESEYELTR